MRLDVDSDAEIWLKLEVLQPVRSFKIRGAGNAILQATDEELADGVLTASAGNMAQGVAYAARLRGVPATIVVPEHAPQTKIDAIERYGGRVIKVPYEEWWQVLVTGSYEGARRAVRPPGRQRPRDGGQRHDRARAARAARPTSTRSSSRTAAAACVTGIASAVKAARPDVRFFAAEPETGAPVAATLAAGTPTAVEYTPSFVDGSGSRELIPRVWEQASQLLDGAFALPLDEVAAAVRLIAERARVIAEGAGALAVAAALSGRLGGAKKVVCIVSGGNIDPAVLSRILVGETAVNVDAVRARFSSLAERLRLLRRAGRHAGARRGRAGDRERAARGVGQPRRAVCDRPRGRGDPRAREGRRSAVPRLLRPTRSRSG